MAELRAKAKQQEAEKRILIYEGAEGFSLPGIERHGAASRVDRTVNDFLAGHASIYVKTGETAGHFGGIRRYGLAPRSGKLAARVAVKMLNTTSSSYIQIQPTIKKRTSALAAGVRVHLIEPNPKIIDETGSWVALPQEMPTVWADVWVEIELAFDIEKKRYIWLQIGNERIALTQSLYEIPSAETTSYTVLAVRIVTGADESIDGYLDEIALVEI